MPALITSCGSGIREAFHATVVAEAVEGVSEQELARPRYIAPRLSFKLHLKLACIHQQAAISP
jgi:hypothetical protein